MRAPWWLAACAAIAAAPSAARAQAMGGDIPIDGFRPALDTRGFVTVDGGEVLAPFEPSFGLVTTWARGLHVDDVVTPTLIGAIGLPVLPTELALSLPFGVIGDDDGGMQGVGDLGLHLKARLLARKRWTAALALDATLPTATSDVWLGSGAPTGGARAIVETRRDRWRFGLNAGFRARVGGDAVAMDLTMGPSVPLGGAASWAISPKLDVIGEVGAAVPLRGDYAPVEASLALRVRLAEASHFTVGGGTGLADRAGSPDLRVFAAIVFEPRRGDVRHVEIPDGPLELAALPPPPARDETPLLDETLDSDGDGLRDLEDLCVDEAEDFDGVEDGDGCPEPGRRVAIGEGVLEVFEDIHFAFDSAVIAEESHDILRVIARTLLDNPSLRKIEIGGHTDARGGAAYNRDLSQRRAEAVRTFLIDDGGVSADRLTAVGYGEDRAKVKGRGESAWQANRRVEFVIVERE
jgi:outer membrane protein OmpA-like peptidoglycan-associated protein